MSKIIMYLLYGNDKDYITELTLSALSALAHLDSDDEIKICIATDTDDLTMPFAFEKILISPQEFSAWTLDGKYRHRAKPFSILNALGIYGQKIIFADTDTIFQENPVKLFSLVSKDNSLMHQRDCLVRENDSYVRLLRKLDNSLELAQFNLHSDTPIYNSGIIGVQQENKHLLEEAIYLMDILYGIEPIFNLEQFAIGVALERSTKVNLCSSSVVHYWGVARGFARVQAYRLIPAVANEERAHLRAIFKRTRFGVPATPIRIKLIAKIYKFINAWTEGYRYAVYCYMNAIYYSHKDVDYANEWMLLAAEFAAKYDKPSHESLHTDFPLIFEDETPNWMYKSTSEKWKSVIA